MYMSLDAHTHTHTHTHARACVCVCACVQWVGAVYISKFLHVRLLGMFQIYSALARRAEGATTDAKNGKNGRCSC